ncbi:hypothetical protein HI914_03059 [Erysiphe necator]|nr:hypothetical protein HI914_03059 [Erysiphe necator]
MKFENTGSGTVRFCSPPARNREMPIIPSRNSPIIQPSSNEQQQLETQQPMAVLDENRITNLIAQQLQILVSPLINKFNDLSSMSAPAEAPKEPSYV